jgi:hypothetical protein
MGFDLMKRTQKTNDCEFTMEKPSGPENFLLNKKYFLGHTA